MKDDKSEGVQEKRLIFNAEYVSETPGNDIATYLDLKYGLKKSEYAFYTCQIDKEGGYVCNIENYGLKELFNSPEPYMGVLLMDISVRFC